MNRKRTLSLLFSLLFSLTITSNSFAQVYCAASGPACNKAGNTWVSNLNVSPGGFSNNSACASGGASPGYTNFTSQVITMLIGTEYTISVAEGVPFPADVCFAWVDLNKDGDFVDANESITMAGSSDVGYSGTITIPVGTATGNTRFRVRVLDGSANVGFTSSCGTTAYGEVEDYTVNITNTPPPANYCPASGSCDPYIARVTLQTGLSNTSGCGAGGYEDFTLTDSATLQISSPSQFTVNISPNYIDEQIAIYVDWNQDKDFDETDEFIGAFANANPYTGVITPPTSALLGKTRMRIVPFLAPLEIPDPCGSVGGEVEDYKITVIGCSGSTAPADAITDNVTGTWQNKVLVTVTENNNVSSTNFQVPLIFNSQALIAAGKLKLNGSDLRFGNCDLSTRYNYWIESGINTSTTIVWVMLPSLPAGGTATFFMHYNNDAATVATASSFDNTFPPSTRLVVAPCNTTVVSGTNNYSWFEVSAGGTALITPSGTPFVVNARKIKITGIIDGNGQGFAGGASSQNGAGPGGGKTASAVTPANTSGGGGGYGGSGGRGNVAAGTSGSGGVANGNTSTINMGSGGGGPVGSGAGATDGYGGAGVTLNARVVEITGDVNLNGNPGTSAANVGWCGGGGAGGGLLLKAYNTLITGRINAIGGRGGSGNAGGGGGGGGRINLLSEIPFTSGTYNVSLGIRGNTVNTANPASADGSTGVIFTGTYAAKEPTIVISPELTLTLTSSDADNSFCSGTNVTFTAGTGFSNYEFYRNSVSVQNGAGTTYSTTALTNGDSIKVFATLASGCRVNTFIKNTVILTKTSTFTSPASLCVNEIGTITYSGTGTIAGNYTWSFDGADIVTGTNRGPYTVKWTTPGVKSVTLTVDEGGCTSTVTTNTVTVNPLPTISLGTNPSVCRGTTASSLPYTATTNTPNQYSIDYDAVANTAGFVDVALTTLPASPISITVPGAATAATYNATITVRNSTTGCSSTTTAFTVTINASPTITLGANPSVCSGTTTVNLPYTATTNSPNEYSIDYNVAANTAGFVDVTLNTLPTSPIVLTVPGAAAPGTYNATLIVKNSITGCSSTSSSFSVTVVASPTITLGSSPVVCRGVTSSGLPYTATTNSPNQYTINYDATAEAAGFVDVAATALPVSPIGITIPATAAAAIYNATITVINTTTGCTSAAIAFTVTVNETTITLGSNPIVNRTITSADLPYTATTGSPNQYSIDYDVTAQGQGFSDVPLTALPSSPISLVIPSTPNLGTYNATITVINSTTGCSNTVAFTVRIIAFDAPTITLGSSPSVCKGITTASLPYSTTTNSPNEYKIDYDAVALAAGFINVAYSTLPASPINIVVPAGASPATYNATITVKNTTTTSEGVETPFTITVKPIPSVNSASTGSICSGIAQNYDITSAISGTTYTWDRAAVADISNTALSGQTTDPITETLTNTGTAAAVVQYIITPTANGCTGSAFNYDVTVNPTPTVSSAATGTVCSGVAQNYDIISATSGSTFSWDRAVVAGISNTAISAQTADPIIESLTNTTTAAVVVRYVITPSANSCTGTAFNYDVTVNPSPTVSSAATGTVCSGIAQNYDIMSATSNTTYSWNRAAVTGISNTAASAQSADPIIESLINTTASAVVVRYVITPSANSCTGTPFNYDVTVNPTPTVSSAATGTVCSGIAQNYDITSATSGTTYTWNRAAVTGISNTAASAQTADPIIESLTNTTSAAVDVRYVITPSANSCTGTAFNYDVTVNPTPTVSSTATGTVCSGVAQNYDITSATTGTTFSWDRAATTGISNSAVNGQTADPITEQLTNSTTDAQLVQYIITPSANTCTGPAFNYNVTVNPAPTVSSASTGVVCSAIAQNYDITSATSGTTYTWNRAAVAGISNSAVSGQTADPIIESLTNTTSAAVVVRYVITPSANSCTGSAFNYDVTVNPTPIVTSASTGVICSGVSQNYDITSSTSSTSYNWRRAFVTGISNAAANGQTADPISEALTNTTTSSLVVNYVITPYANGCSGPEFNYDVTVKPKPVITSAATGNICSSIEHNYTITSNLGSTTYSWDRAAVSSVSNAAVADQTSNPIIETLTNTTSTSAVVRYIITPISNGCTGRDFNYDLTVKPTPVVSSSPTGIICSGIAQNYTISSSVSGSSYSWDRAVVSGISNSAVIGQTNNPITESLTNTTTASAIVRYIITPTASSCVGSAFNYDVTVKPKPSITSTSTGIVCSEVAQNYLISSNVSGSTYSWNRPAVSGISNPAITSQTNNPITESLANTTTAAVNVTYVITPSNNGCTGNAFNYVVTVNPKPTINSAAAGTVCSGIAQNYTITSTIAGTTYNWSRAVKSGISNPAVSNQTDNPITEALMNNSASAVDVTYAITPIANSCSGNLFNYVVTVNPTLVPAVSIAITSGSNPSCAGNSVTFTATPVNEGTAPIYQWKVNGNNVGTNSTTFTSTSLINNDVVTCNLTSNALCANPSSVTSTGISMAITPLISPTVTIAISSGSNPACNGSSVTFTATPTNGGATPVYQWKVNGINTGTNSSTFTTTSLANNDVVACVLTSNATCVSPATATSNGINMTISPLVTPLVSIALSAGANPTCSGKSVSYTATPTNGGTIPAFQWKVNGVNVGVNSDTYTSSSFANNDVISCVLTSNAACASPTTATSPDATISVIANVTPTVSIAISSGSNPSCQGSPVTFFATPTNGGSFPSYQWKLNGANVGTNNSSYSSSSLANNDILSVVLTSNATCANPTFATSNGTTMLVSPMVNPSVSIAISSGSNSSCEGSQVTFTATPTNGGGSPMYQWKLNGNNVGANSSQYSSTSLVYGDVINCILTSNAFCRNWSTTNSNNETMLTTAVVNPSVVIEIISGTNPTCPDAEVVFTATPTNGGFAPAYQWKLNGSNVGTNSNSYSSTTLSADDLVSTELTSSINCVSAKVTKSNTIKMGITDFVSPEVSIVISDGSNQTCSGESISLKALPSNGGKNPSYQWQVNGNDVGTDNSLFTTTNMQDNSVVTCIMTSSLVCSDPLTAVSEDRIFSVYEIPEKPVITKNGPTLTSSADNGNQWYLNDEIILGATAKTFKTIYNGLYTVIVTSEHDCTSAKSDALNVIKGVGIGELDEDMLSIYPNPNNGQFNLLFTAGTKADYKVELSNELGQIVYKEELKDFNGAYSKTLNVEEFGKGFYMISVRSYDYHAVGKVIVY